MRHRQIGRVRPRKHVNSSDLQDAFHYALMSLGGYHGEYESAFVSQHRPTASERKRWAAKSRAVLRGMGIRVSTSATGETLLKIASDAARSIGYDAFTDTRIS